MKRRHFLSLTAATLGGLTTLACRPAPNEVHALEYPDLLIALGPTAIRAIGKAYRSANPREDEVISLQRAILAERSLRSRIFGGKGVPVAALVRRDFAENNTVVIDGWILAVTEARQCALYSHLPV